MKRLITVLMLFPFLSFGQTKFSQLSPATPDANTSFVGLKYSGGIYTDYIFTAPLMKTYVNTGTSGDGVAPGIAAGAGAGTTPTITLAAGSDNKSGIITIVTGTSPAANSAIVTLTFDVAYASKAVVVISPYNAPAAALYNTTQIYANASLTQFFLESGTAALTAGTTYKWNYVVVGY